MTDETMTEYTYEQYVNKEEYIDCSSKHITSLKGCKEIVTGTMDCNWNKLTNLVGGPKKVGEDFKCAHCGLVSLEGAPEEVGCDFVCNNNQLDNLKGGPKKVGYNYYCHSNHLKSLEGSPESVGKNFDCSKNDLKTMKGAPKSIRNTCDCSDNKDLIDISDLPSDCQRINLTHCNNVKVFTKDITTEDGQLEIRVNPNAKHLIERIKNWPYYEVVNTSYYYITVKLKSDNEIFMNNL